MVKDRPRPGKEGDKIADKVLREGLLAENCVIKKRGDWRWKKRVRTRS